MSEVLYVGTVIEYEALKKLSTSAPATFEALERVMHKVCNAAELRVEQWSYFCATSLAEEV